MNNTRKRKIKKERSRENKNSQRQMMAKVKNAHVLLAYKAAVAQVLGDNKAAMRMAQQLLGFVGKKTQSMINSAIAEVSLLRQAEKTLGLVTSSQEWIDNEVDKRLKEASEKKILTFQTVPDDIKPKEIVAP